MHILYNLLSRKCYVITLPRVYCHLAAILSSLWMGKNIEYSMGAVHILSAPQSWSEIILYILFLSKWKCLLKTECVASSCSLETGSQHWLMLTPRSHHGLTQFIDRIIASVWCAANAPNFCKENWEMQIKWIKNSVQNFCQRAWDKVKVYKFSL